MLLRVPLYVGQTGNLHQRLNANWTNHDHMTDIVRHKTARVSVMPFYGSESERFEIETDLRRWLKPIYNRQTWSGELSMRVS
jgi:hypothetical protein